MPSFEQPPILHGTGRDDFMRQENSRQKRAASSYRKGDITLSEAAHRAGLTLWDMERYLIEQGIASSYSTDDLERELHALGDPHSSGRGRAK